MCRLTAKSKRINQHQPRKRVEILQTIGRVAFALDVVEQSRRQFSGERGGERGVRGERAVLAGVIVG